MHDDFNQQGLITRGFIGFQPLRALPRRCPALPSTPGVYAVTIDGPFSGFLATSVGGHFKGSDPTVDVERLRENWLDGVSTVYIGRATDLRKRVDLLARYGRGEAVAHQGGRFLWQLQDCDRLRVCWKADANPVEAEAQLLDEFEACFGQLPFANLVRGSRLLVAA